MTRAALWFIITLHLVGASEFQLPTDIKPKHYDLKLLFDVDPATNFSFFGVVDILLSANRPTSRIVLHAKDFEIGDDAIILSGQSTPPRAKSAFFDEEHDFLIITFDGELQKDLDYTLTILFYGNVPMKLLQGVYISSFVNKETKVEEYQIVTQFESIAARKGFPCFDEPAFKATFSITIGHHQRFTALSNMPLKSTVKTNVLLPHWSWELIQKKVQKDMSEFVWDEFEKSVPMSTYLVAFVVSQFVHVESPAGLSSTRFRVWARRDAKHQTSYAATIGPRLLSYFEKFFDVPYSLPKVDVVAIPDFLGAMENWGLIIHSEMTLLYDEHRTPIQLKSNIAGIIAHELAHQWFGNLVTMKWWSDLWLKEGFANFMASQGVAEIEQSWDFNNDIVKGMLSVLHLDALESSHPVSVPIEDPSRISEIYDSLSYSKSATLIRMMKMFVGDDVFRRGLHNYLTKYAYKNTEPDDLFQELTVECQAQGQCVDVKQVMDSWTNQIGYPLLTVIRNYSDTSLSIYQRRYIPHASRSHSQSWWVPLRVLCEGDDATRRAALTWLKADEGLSSHHRYQHYSTPDQWVLFNHDLIGIYRVNYDERNWRLLSDTLNSDRYTDVPVLGRVQLLSDALELAFTNRLDYSIALQLTSYLKQENEYWPLFAGTEKLEKIKKILRRTQDYGIFQKFVRGLITETYKNVGGLFEKKIFHKNNLRIVELQTLISKWACETKVPGCEDNAIELFDKWMTSPHPDKENPIPLDLRLTVCEVAIDRGNERHWRFAFDRLKNLNEATERVTLIKALARSRQTWIIKHYLETAVAEGSWTAPDDVLILFTAVLSSETGYSVAKDFIYSRVADLLKKVKIPKSLGQVIATLASEITTQRELDEFDAWRQSNYKYLSESKMTIEQGMEMARINIMWIARNQRAVVEKLTEITSVENEVKKVAKKVAKRIRGGVTNTQTPAALFIYLTSFITRVF